MEFLFFIAATTCAILPLVVALEMGWAIVKSSISRGGGKAVQKTDCALAQKPLHDIPKKYGGAAGRFFARLFRAAVGRPGWRLQHYPPLALAFVFIINLAMSGLGFAALWILFTDFFIDSALALCGGGAPL